MVSHSSLPCILQPTRVTDHSATVIDDIFSNITDYETYSGNITTLTADHFAQFLIIKKCYVSYKSSNYPVYDYTNFEKETFIHDYSLTDQSFLDNSDISIHDHSNTFYEKTTECINNHIP